MDKLERLIIALYAAERCNSELAWSLIDTELKAGTELGWLDVSQLWAVGTP